MKRKHKRIRKKIYKRKNKSYLELVYGLLDNIDLVSMYGSLSVPVVNTPGAKQVSRSEVSKQFEFDIEHNNNTKQTKSIQEQIVEQLEISMNAIRNAVSRISR